MKSLETGKPFGKAIPSKFRKIQESLAKSKRRKRPACQREHERKKGSQRRMVKGKMPNATVTRLIWQVGKQKSEEKRNSPQFNRDTKEPPKKEMVKTTSKHS